jgi:hypothetical protein
MRGSFGSRYLDPDYDGSDVIEGMLIVGSYPVENVLVVVVALDHCGGCQWQSREQERADGGEQHYVKDRK